MKLNIRLLLLAGSVGLVTMLSSCQSTGAAADATSAVTCDKCKTVWVKRAVQTGTPGKGNYYALKDVKSMECPDCESAVVTFFKTGQFKHTCSHCGGTMTHCTQH